MSDLLDLNDGVSCEPGKRHALCLVLFGMSCELYVAQVFLPCLAFHHSGCRFGRAWERWEEYGKDCGYSVWIVKMIRAEDDSVEM